MIFNSWFIKEDLRLCAYDLLPKGENQRRLQNEERIASVLLQHNYTFMHREWHLCIALRTLYLQLSSNSEKISNYEDKIMLNEDCSFLHVRSISTNQKNSKNKKQQSGAFVCVIIYYYEQSGETRIYVKVFTAWKSDHTVYLATCNVWNSACAYVFLQGHIGFETRRTEMCVLRFIICNKKSSDLPGKLLHRS